jgi:hypothetical protein
VSETRDDVLAWLNARIAWHQRIVEENPYTTGNDGLRDKHEQAADVLIEERRALAAVQAQQCIGQPCRSCGADTWPANTAPGGWRCSRCGIDAPVAVQAQPASPEPLHKMSCLSMKGSRLNGDPFPCDCPASEAQPASADAGPGVYRGISWVCDECQQPLQMLPVCKTCQRAASARPDVALEADIRRTAWEMVEDLFNGDYPPKVLASKATAASLLMARLRLALARVPAPAVSDFDTFMAGFRYGCDYMEPPCGPPGIPATPKEAYAALQRARASQGEQP